MPIIADPPTLFTAAELGEFIEKPVTDARAEVLEAIVWGWLVPVLHWTLRPNPVPPELYGWALTLGAIAAENPTGLSAKDIGPFKSQFSEERRRAVLDEVARSGLPLAAPAAPSQASGDFPAADCYPDPAW